MASGTRIDRCLSYDKLSYLRHRDNSLQVVQEKILRHSRCAPGHLHVDIKHCSRTQICLLGLLVLSDLTFQSGKNDCSVIKDKFTLVNLPISNDAWVSNTAPFMISRTLQGLMNPDSFPSIFNE